MVETSDLACINGGDFGGGQGDEGIGRGDFVGIGWGGRTGPGGSLSREENLVTIADAEGGVGLDVEGFGTGALYCSTLGVPVIKANISGDTSDLRDKSFPGGGADAADEGTCVFDLGDPPMAAWRVSEAAIVVSGGGFRVWL